MARVVFAFCVALLLPLVWVIAAFNGQHRQCVPLTNGALLGYAAVFDLGRKYLRPIVVPKLKDGTPIVSDKLWSIKVSRTTVYGSSFETGYHFAWRLDTGVVMREDNPRWHDEIVADAGSVNNGIESDSIGAGALFLELKARAGGGTERCRTWLVTW